MPKKLPRPHKAKLIIFQKLKGIDLIMRKIICLLLALTFALAFVSCGEKTTDEPKVTDTDTGSENTSDTATAEGYSFTFNNIKITPHENMATVLQSLGDPVSYYEKASCAFVGLDKQYTYQNFVIDTYPLDGVDYVSAIYLQTDAVATNEGIRVGSAESDVVAAYGEGDGTGTYVYVLGRTQLTIITRDSLVTSIQYSAVQDK